MVLTHITSHESNAGSITKISIPFIAAVSISAVSTITISEVLVLHMAEVNSSEQIMLLCKINFFPQMCLMPSGPDQADARNKGVKIL